MITKLLYRDPNLHYISDKALQKESNEKFVNFGTSLQDMISLSKKTKERESILGKFEDKMKVMMQAKIKEAKWMQSI
jgi:hypothetical protein